SVLAVEAAEQETFFFPQRVRRSGAAVADEVPARFRSFPENQVGPSGRQPRCEIEHGNLSSWLGVKGRDGAANSIPDGCALPAVADIATMGLTVAARRDALLQLDDLEAALPLLLAGLRFLLRLVLARFHREPPFRRSAVSGNGHLPARRPSAG